MPVSEEKIVALAEYYIAENDLKTADVLISLIPLSYHDTKMYNDLTIHYQMVHDQLVGKKEPKAFKRGYTGDDKPHKNKSDKRRERNERRKFKENGGMEEDY